MAKETQILFIDEELASLNEIASIFDSEPYGVLAVSRPEEARESLKRENIKVVVCAQKFQNKDSLEFLKEVKESSPEIVRLLLIGESGPMDEAALAQDIIAGLIHKPLRNAALLSSIRQALRFHDLDAENKRIANEIKKLHIQYDDQKDMTNIVSHELRTPLASVKAAIDLVVKGMLGPINQPQNDVLKRAQESIDRLKKLTDEILDLTKLEAKKMKMNIKPNDLNTAIREVAHAHREVADGKGLYLKTKLNEEIPWIPFDKPRIVQVINNLLSNALKYTQKGGVTIFSDLDAQNRHVIVSVRDTGKGIAEENVAIIFEKFQRVESDDGSAEKGTGLGLTISRAIVHSHNGKIWAESQLGKGSAFHFILPLQQTETTNL